MKNETDVREKLLLFHRILKVAVLKFNRHRFSMAEKRFAEVAGRILSVVN